MMMIRRILLALALVLQLSPAVAQQPDSAGQVDALRARAEQGHADAQAKLGLFYDVGLGVPQDYAEAVRWYRKAAEQGNAAAQALLGIMYESGWGIARDPVRAHMWYNLAAARDSNKGIRAYAVNGRDRVAQQLTAAQLREAQRLARAWRPGRD